MGTVVALPALDAMLPRTRSVQAIEKAAAPRRMAFIYVPNGCHMEDWTPAAEGTDYELPPILQPLASVKDDVMVLTGLTCDKARPNGDGAGDHARASSAFLTGARPARRPAPISAPASRPTRSRRKKSAIRPPRLAGDRHRTIPRLGQLRQRLFVRL